MPTLQTSIDLILAKFAALPKHASEDDYVQQIVEVIKQKLEVEFVGIYLIREGTAYFQVGTGKLGNVLLKNKHKITINKSPDLLAGVAKGEIRILAGWSGKLYNCTLPTIAQSYAALSPTLVKEYSDITHSQKTPSFSSPSLPKPVWEIYLPLRTKQKIFGALTLQVSEYDRFKLDEIVHYLRLADQVASLRFLEV